LSDEQKPIVKSRTRYKKGEKTVVPAFAGMELVIPNIHNLFPTGENIISLADEVEREQ
jgi:hypothetical protein